MNITHEYHFHWILLKSSCPLMSLNCFAVTCLRKINEVKNRGQQCVNMENLSWLWTINANWVPSHSLGNHVLHIFSCNHSSLTKLQKGCGTVCTEKCLHLLIVIWQGDILEESLCRKMLYAHLVRELGSRLVMNAILQDQLEFVIPG